MLSPDLQRLIGQLVKRQHRFEGVCTLCACEQVHGMACARSVHARMLHSCCMQSVCRSRHAEKTGRFVCHPCIHESGPVPTVRCQLAS